MAASQNDYFTYVGSPGNATTLASPGYTIGGTTINVGSTSNWNTVTGQFFAIDRVTVVNGVQTQVPGSYTVWEGVVSGPTSVTSMVLRYGTDQNYSAGSTTRVYIVIASARENRMVDGILAHANQDGSLKQAAVTAGVANGSITYAKLLSTIFSGTLATMATQGSYQYGNIGGLKILFGTSQLVGVGANSTTIFTLTFPGSFFSTAPKCFATSRPVGNAQEFVNLGNATTTTDANFIFINNSGGTQSFTADIFAIGT